MKLRLQVFLPPHFHVYVFLEKNNFRNISFINWQAQYDLSQPFPANSKSSIFVSLMVSRILLTIQATCTYDQHWFFGSLVLISLISSFTVTIYASILILLGSQLRVMNTHFPRSISSSNEYNGLCTFSVQDAMSVAKKHFEKSKTLLCMLDSFSTHSFLKFLAKIKCNIFLSVYIR